MTHWIIIPRETIQKLSLINGSNSIFDIKFTPLEEIDFSFVNPTQDTGIIQQISKYLIKQTIKLK